MNKVVWIFGYKASGKEAFIKEAVGGNKNIVELMKWEDRNIVYVPESVSYVEQYNEDPIVDKRIKIVDRVMSLNEKNDNSIILIKGQDADIDNNIIDILKEKVQNVDYEIAFLVSDVNTISKRIKNKSSLANENYDMEELSKQMINRANKVETIEDMNVTTIDITDGYTITQFPE